MEIRALVIMLNSHAKSVLSLSNIVIHHQNYHEVATITTIPKFALHCRRIHTFTAMYWLRITFQTMSSHCKIVTFFKFVRNMGGSPGDVSEEQSSFSNLSFTSPTSQLILQPFHRFTYVTAHSPTPSFVFPTSPGEPHMIHHENSITNLPISRNYQSLP